MDIKMRFQDEILGMKTSFFSEDLKQLKEVEKLCCGSKGTQSTVESMHLWKAEISDVSSSIQQMQQNLKQLEDKFSQQSSQNKELIDQIEKIKKQESSETQKKTLRKLYGRISKIHWDSNAEPGRYEGYIVGKQVVPFSLTKGEQSDVFISNHLWDMISRRND